MLVLGASGFVGGAVAEAASLAGWQVTGAGRRRPVRCADAISVDLADPASLRAACRGADVVVHAAGLAHVRRSAERGADFEAVNVQGTAAVVQAAAAEGVRRLVLVSSVSVYGDARDATSRAPAVDETMPCRPTSPYARSKLAAEAVAGDAAAAAGLDLVVVRLATVYGPGDPGNVARLMRLIDQGRFVWIGSGENRKTLIYVDDVGRALTAAAAPGGPSGTYNLAAPPVSMTSAVEELARALGRSVPRVRVPAGPSLAAARLLRLFGPGGLAVADTITRLTMNDVYDGARFQQAFGWRPTVPMRVGFQREVAWYRAGSARDLMKAPAAKAPTA
jgi:nucleoside-diphosphate-sugar epimerase